MKVFLFLLGLLPLSFAIKNVKITKQDLDALAQILQDVKLDVSKPFEVKKEIATLGKENDYSYHHYFMEQIVNHITLESGIQADVNDYADRLLRNLSQVIIRHGLDPIDLPDHKLSWFMGSMKLYKGSLQDLSTLHRGGDATASYSSRTKILIIDVPICFDSLMFTYEYHTQEVLLSINGDAEGNLQHVEIDVRLSYNFETYQFKLEKFDMRNTGKITVKFTGNGITDLLLDTMADLVTGFLKPLLVDIIQTIIGGNLGKALGVINEFIAKYFTP